MGVVVATIPLLVGGQRKEYIQHCEDLGPGHVSNNDGVGLRNHSRVSEDQFQQLQQQLRLCWRRRHQHVINTCTVGDVLCRSLNESD